MLDDSHVARTAHHPLLDKFPQRTAHPKDQFLPRASGQLEEPSVHSLQGQRMVLTPGRGDQWYAWLQQMLRARGLSLVEATPEDHDRAMAVVQVLTHFATEVMGKALADIGVSLETTLNYTSPVYLMELLMTARHFAQSPELYGSIQMSNPLTGQVTAAFVRAATEHKAVVESGDAAGMNTMFEQVRGFFGEFTDRALEQSNYMVDNLVQWMK